MNNTTETLTEAIDAVTSHAEDNYYLSQLSWDLEAIRDKISDIKEIYIVKEHADLPDGTGKVLGIFLDKEDADELANKQARILSGYRPEVITFKKG